MQRQAWIRESGGLYSVIMVEVQEIFLALNGVRPKEIVQRKLAGGLANAGVYVHVLQQKKNAGGIAVSKVLEKRTLRKHEIKVANAIREWSDRDGDGARVFPAIFAVQETPDHYSIFMEYLEKAGNPPAEESDSVANIIVTSVWRLNEGMTGQDVGKQTKKTLESWEKRIEAAHTKFGLADTGQRIVRRVSKQLAKQPVFMSHNDLFWPNMAFDSAAGTVRLLDFGLVGNNIAGAEFHHFFRRGLRSKKTARFFDMMIEKYSEKTGLSIRLLTLASQCYALVRAYERVGRIREAKGEEAFQQEMSLIRKIERKLSKELRSSRGPKETQPAPDGAMP